jgi:FtsH-binding integral membrane protein
MKKLFNDSRWEPIFILLGNIAMFEWIIFPGLTVASTFINMLTVLVFIAMFLFDLNYIKETWFTKPEEEKIEEEKWKQKIEELQKEVAKKVKTKKAK